MRFFYVYNGKRIYGKNRQELRMKVLFLIATYGEGNMEISAPIFQEDGGDVKISDRLYMKELPGEKVYFCYEDCNNKRTFRTYYDLDDVWWSKKEKEIPWIEIFSMRGKSLLAKDCYETVGAE